MPRPPPSSLRPAPAPPPRPADSGRGAPGEGHRLDAVLERSARAWTPLSEAFSCYVVAEVAGLLHAAHALTDSRGHALGLACRAVTPFHVRLTGAGRVRLEGLDAPSDSLAYAAPECARRQPLDARAEVFSLGLVLVQLLTGRHLFPGAERFEAEVRRAGASADPMREACARELEERLRAYGPAELASATRAVSVELRPLVHRALAVKPEERHANPAELAHALREHLRRTGPSSGPPFGPARVRAELEALGL